jgi:DNA-3-methyladenine glycosylase II
MTKLNSRFRIVLNPKRPYDFGLTVHKPAGWSLFSSFEVYENGKLWTALHIGNRLVGLKLHASGRRNARDIVIDAFTEKKPGKVFVNLVRGTLRAKLSADEDLKDFYSLAKRDKILTNTLKDLYGMHSTEDADLFSIALLAITLQMAPLKRSEEMLDSLIRNYGEVAEFDDRKVGVPPLPQTLANISAKELKSRCKLGYRARYIVKLAAVISRGFPSLEELRCLGQDEAKNKIMTLPGIGDYSADIINPGGGFPIDVWSADVFGKLFYGKEPKNGRKEIKRIKKEGVKRWGLWSWYAFFYVVNDLENLSKRLGITLRLQ